MANKTTVRRFFLAIRHDDADAVRAMLAEDPSLVNSCALAPPKKDDGQSPLQVALKTGHCAIANLLLDHGADPRFIETSCARLVLLLRQYAHAVTIYRTSGEARKAMDPLVLADGRHFLHRFHIDQPRASLTIGHPQLARPLVTRFEQIWATGEPGLSASVLGL